MHVPGLNGTINALGIRVFIPTNRSKYSQYEYTHGLGDVTTVILIVSLYDVYLINYLQPPYPIFVAYNIQL